MVRNKVAFTSALQRYYSKVFSIAYTVGSLYINSLHIFKAITFLLFCL